MYSSFKAIYSVSVMTMLKRCNCDFKILFSILLILLIIILLILLINIANQIFFSMRFTSYKQNFCFGNSVYKWKKCIFTDIELANRNST